MTAAPERTLVVVGGGISGLAAAWYAAAAGWRVTVLEASARVGGKLQVRELAGVEVDVGAESMLVVRPEGVSLLDDARVTRSGLLAPDGTEHELDVLVVADAFDAGPPALAGIADGPGRHVVVARPGRVPCVDLQDQVAAVVGTIVGSAERAGTH